jgi:hypothetical protein
MSTPTKSRRLPVKVCVHPNGLTEVFYRVNAGAAPKPKVWQSITCWFKPGAVHRGKTADAN